MQYMNQKEDSKATSSEKSIIVFSIGFFVVGTVGYFALQRDNWIFYFFAHLGALGVMGLFGSVAGVLARKKNRSYWLAFSLGFLLPIILSIVAVLISLWGVNGQLFCGGTVSLIVAIIIVIFYSFLKKRKFPQVKYTD